MRASLSVALAFGFVCSVGCTASNPNFNIGNTADFANGSQDLAGADLVGVVLDLTGKPTQDGSADDLTLSAGDMVIVGDPCNNEGGACALSSTTAGICRAGVCAACIDPDDDGACSFAYGGPRLCIAGSCVPGQCRDSTDCEGKLCLGTSCVGCMTTPQCQADPAYGTSSICNGFDGTCISLECTVSNDQPTTGCGGTNTVCCSATLQSGSNGTCQSGSCCQDSDCDGGRTCVKTGTDSNAVAGVCSTCAAPSGNTYYVDPIDGDDTMGTGADGIGCAFRTITKALNAMPGVIPAGTKIIVRGGDTETPLDDGELYPITVPTNVTITIDPDSADILVAPSAGQAFIMLGKSVRLGGTDNNRFIIDGENTFSNEAVGITTLPGCDATVDHVLIRNYDGNSGKGILVGGGGKIVTGVETEIADNTTGIVVASRTSGATTLIGNLQANFAATPFVGEFGLYVHDNKTGLSVTGRGWVSLVADFDDQSLQISANETANVSITQTNATQAETNLIDGAHVIGPSARGINLVFGSRLKLRHSRSVGNDYGVYIAPNSISTGTSPNPAGIDLGKGGEAGDNRFQDGALPNSKAGLCVASVLEPTAPVDARGNQFGAIDCATNNPGAVVTNDANDCNGGVDVGFDDLNPVAANMAKIFDLQGCTAN